MKRQLKIGSYKTGDDWSLILNDKKITPASPKTSSLTIEGRDGDIDTSESLGEIRYDNRKATFTLLSTEGSYADRMKIYGDILNYCNGRIRRIEEPDKPGFYLSARWEVSAPKIVAGDLFSFEISSDNVNPYYEAVSESVKKYTLSNTAQKINLKNNGRKTVIPEIEVNGTATITFGAYTSGTLSSTTYELLDIGLTSGDNILTIRGSGTLKFIYREAVL